MTLLTVQNNNNNMKRETNKQKVSNKQNQHKNIRFLICQSSEYGKVANMRELHRVLNMRE